MNVLVVDDSRIMRNIIKKTLSLSQELSVNILEAEDGVVAFNTLERENIDILLIDWNMPHLSGLDLIKELRAMPKYRALPIIMITSEAAKYSVIEAIKSGVNDYLIKPVDDKLLISKIRQLMKL